MLQNQNESYGKTKRRLKETNKVFDTQDPAGVLLMKGGWRNRAGC